jgi:ABC-type uncharacterized transport system substrate-binding protein
MSIHAAIGAGQVRPYIEGLIHGLAKHGHPIGAAYEIDYRERPNLDLKNGQAAEAFTAKAGTPYDVIFAMSTTVVRAAKDIKPSIPIVGVVSDPRAEGFSRARNITGISARRSQTAGQCFECFLATVPALKQVHVLHKPGYGPSERALKLVKAAAKKRGVTVKTVPVNTLKDIETKLSKMPVRNPKKPAVAGVMALPADVCLGAARRIIELAQQQKHIPTFFPITDWVTSKQSSALGGFGVPQRQCGELMAEYVNQILWHDAEPSSLKVKEAGDDAFEWVVSSEAAKALNIKIPRVI